MSDPIERNGAMEQSHSVGPLTQIAMPSHLGLIMSPLHHGMPTWGCGACLEHGAAEVTRAGCLGI